MNVRLEGATRERAEELIAEAGVGLGLNPRDRVEAVTAHWACQEAAMHFGEPELVRFEAPSYDGSPGDEAARLAAVLMLQDEAARHAWGFGEEGPPVGMDGPERLVVVHVPRSVAGEDLRGLARGLEEHLPRLLDGQDGRAVLHLEAHPAGPGGCPHCRDRPGPIWSEYLAAGPDPRAGDGEIGDAAGPAGGAPSTPEGEPLEEWLDRLLSAEGHARKGGAAYAISGRADRKLRQVKHAIDDLGRYEKRKTGLGHLQEMGIELLYQAVVGRGVLGRFDPVFAEGEDERP